MIKSNVIKYSLLAIPLSFIGLPIYINISDFYARKFELSLTFLAISLFIIRIIDIISDLIIGYATNTLIAKNYSRLKLIKISVIILIFLFYALFNPPAFNYKLYSGLWLIITLTLSYIFFNIAVINYETIAAIISYNDNQRITINSFKEFFGIIGFLAASIVPYLFNNNIAEDSNFFLTTIFFAIIAFICLKFFLDISFKENITSKMTRIKVFDALKDRNFSRFMLLYIINSIAISIPSATIIFYVRDILHQEKLIGIYLAIYFISAASSIFFWRVVTSKFNIYSIWIIAISCSIIAFSICFFISYNYSNIFIVICFVTGFLSGIDLILPPSIIAKFSKKSLYATSSFFCIYNMSTKLAISIAATSSLLILGQFGYNPSDISPHSITIIPYIYALIPCILRIVVIFMIIRNQKLWM